VCPQSYNAEGVQRYMDAEERANYEGQILELTEALMRAADKPIPGAIRSLERIANALERLLKYTEMNL